MWNLPEADKPEIKHFGVQMLWETPLIILTQKKIPRESTDNKKLKDRVTNSDVQYDIKIFPPDKRVVLYFWE